MKKFKFEEWLDEKGGGCELILICLFWKFIFDPIIYLTTNPYLW